MENCEEQGKTLDQAECNSSAEEITANENAVPENLQQPVKSDKRIVLKTILANVLVTVGMLAAYDTYVAQKIVAVDLKGFIEQQRVLFVSGKINEEQMRRNFDRIEEIKKKVPKNRVIIMGDVLLRNDVEIIEP